MKTPKKIEQGHLNSLTPINKQKNVLNLNCKYFRQRKNLLNKSCDSYSLNLAKRLIIVCISYIRIKLSSMASKPIIIRWNWISTGSDFY